MNLRYARHTNNIKALTDFYTQVIGLEILGNFENRSNYNGVFLGLPNLDWHIEFTESEDPPIHNSDDDDLIVLYLDSTHELNLLKNRIIRLGLRLSKSKNPYWQKNGIEIKDPDNFGVVLTIKPS